MNLAKSIQYVVKKRMKALDMSVSEMESKAGVGRSVLGNFLSGTRENPTLETLTRMSEALECTVADLFNLELADKQEQKVIECINWKESLFKDCVNVVIKIINEECKKTPNSHRKVLDANKIIFIINQVYKFSIKDKPTTSSANEKFAEFLIEGNFPSI